MSINDQGVNPGSDPSRSNEQRQETGSLCHCFCVSRGLAPCSGSLLNRRGCGVQCGQEQPKENKKAEERQVNAEAFSFKGSPA